MANNPDNFERITIDLTGRGGLSKKFGGDFNRQGVNGSLQAGQPNLRYLAEENEMVSGVFDPVLRNGYLSPAVGSSVTIKTATTSGDYFAQVMQVDEVNTEVYFFISSNRHIEVSDFGGMTITNDHTVTLSLTSFLDSAIYSKNGVRTMFYAYKNLQDCIIGEVDLSSGSYNDNWSSNDVSGAFQMATGNCKLVPSGDGFMYVLHNNSVHRVDGTILGGAQGKIYRDVLKGPDWYYITDGIEYRNNLYMVIHRNTSWQTTSSQNMNDYSSTTDNVGIYIWNKQAQFNSSSFIQLPGVSHIRRIYISPKGDLRIICLLPNGDTQIRSLSGSSFVTVATLPFGSYPTVEDGLFVYGNYTYWHGSDGFLYEHGSEFQGEKEAIQIIGQLTPGGVNGDRTGGIAIVDSDSVAETPVAGFKEPDIVYFSDRVVGNGDSHIFKFYLHTGNAVEGVDIQKHQGNIFTPVKLLPTLSNVHHINIICAPIAGVSGTQKEAAVKFYFNQSTTPFMTKYITRDDLAKGYASFEINKSYVNSMQLEIEYFNAATPAPAPDNNYSYLGVADFCPSYAEVVYERTSTIR